ncbi:hypothetical protein [Streptomyces sp. NPDC054849]
MLLTPGWQIKGTGSVATTAADDNVVETEFVLPPGISFAGGRPGPEGRRVFGGTGGSVKGIFKIESWVKPGTYHGDLGNNTAGLTITVRPAGGPQPGPSTSPSPSPSGSTAPSASASASTAPSRQHPRPERRYRRQPGQHTGSAALAAGGLAAVALTLGGALYAMARRRRSA